MLPLDEQFLQKLLDCLLDAVFFLDNSIRIVHCNPAAAEVSGYSLEELRGQPMSLVQVDEAALNEFKQRLARSMEKNGPRYVFAHRLRHKNGITVPVECSVAPLEDDQHRQVGWICVARDITRRIEFEQALRQSEERHRRTTELWLDTVGIEAARTTELQTALRRAQEVDQIKSQLLSNVSHELRTPLTSIRGQTSTLLDYADQIGPEERAEALRIVDQEAARLDELIGHVLDMSRLESGTLHVELVAADLRLLLDEGVRLMAVQAPAHRLVIDVPATLPLVHADPRRVVQVVRNLVDNAIKFSPPGTTVTVKAESQPSIVVVSVHDEGIGIPPEHLDKIFDRFYRVERGGVRTTGVGLGLSISKGLIEAMGGQITVVSRVGKGSTFSFSLSQV